MKRRIMDLIRCPVCLGRLKLQVIAEKMELAAGPVAMMACSTWCELRGLPSADADRDLRRPLDCRVCYAWEIDEGILGCAECRQLYPIVEGVPRLIRGAYDEYRGFFYAHRETVSRFSGQQEAAAALRGMDPSVFDRRSNESFSLQWERFDYRDKTWFKDDAELRKVEFTQSMDLKEDDLRGALILDAGCGNGKLTAAVATYGAEVVGMDLSRSVVRAHANRAAVAGTRAPFVHFIQGNVMEPPFAPGVFDHIHTSGVLHHTPSTERAFLSLLTPVRPGGHIYVQLYRKREAWVGIPNMVIRGITRRLPLRLLYRLCWTMVPLHTALVLLIAWWRGERSPINTASRRERALSLFDNYSPRYQHRYTPEQVRHMFELEQLDNVRDVTLANEARHMVAFVGHKPVLEPNACGAAARSHGPGRWAVIRGAAGAGAR